MLGFAPSEIKSMSVWEFQAAVDGYVAAHCPEGGMTADEEDDIWAALKERMGRTT